MKTAYKRLNHYNRFEIEKLIALGKNNFQIASALSVHPSKISSEINRLKNKPYNTIKAFVFAVEKLPNKRGGKMKMDNNPKLKKF
jgi:IS30 family transposase